MTAELSGEVDSTTKREWLISLQPMERRNKDDWQYIEFARKQSLRQS